MYFIASLYRMFLNLFFKWSLWYNDKQFSFLSLYNNCLKYVFDIYSDCIEKFSCLILNKFCCLTFFP